MREPLGVVKILVARNAALDGLVNQAGQREPRALAAPRITQLLGDEFAEAQAFVQLTHENQAAIGGEPRSLKIHLQRCVERKLEWLVLFFTRWV